MNQRQILIQTIAMLLLTTQETSLGQLLRLCLAAKVDQTITDKTSLQFAEEIIDHPESLLSWISEVVDGDDQYSVDEMIVLSEIKLNNPQDFMKQLFEEMDRLELGT